MNEQSHKLRRGRWLLGALAFMGAATAAYVVGHRRVDLLSISRPIVRLPVGAEYSWLSDTILILWQRANGAVVVRQGNKPFMATVVDVKTMEKAEIRYLDGSPELEKAAAKAGLHVSPDKKWIVFKNSADIRDLKPLMAVRIDGSYDVCMFQSSVQSADKNQMPEEDQVEFDRWGKAAHFEMLTIGRRASSVSDVNLNARGRNSMLPGRQVTTGQHTYSMKNNINHYYWQWQEEKRPGSFTLEVKKYSSQEPTKMPATLFTEHLIGVMVAASSSRATDGPIVLEYTTVNGNGLNSLVSRLSNGKLAPTIERQTYVVYDTGSGRYFDVGDAPVDVKPQTTPLNPLLPQDLVGTCCRDTRMWYVYGDTLYTAPITNR